MIAATWRGNACPPPEAQRASQWVGGDRCRRCRSGYCVAAGVRLQRRGATSRASPPAACTAGSGVAAAFAGSLVGVRLRAHLGLRAWTAAAVCDDFWAFAFGMLALDWMRSTPHNRFDEPLPWQLGHEKVERCRPLRGPADALAEDARSAREAIVALRPDSGGARAVRGPALSSRHEHSPSRSTTSPPPRSASRAVAHRTPVLTSRTADAMHRCASSSSSARTCSAWARSSSAAPTTRSRSSRRSSAARRGGVLLGQPRAGGRAAARLLGMPATIVMPHDAPASRSRPRAATAPRSSLYDRYTEDREAIGQRLAARARHDADPALRPPARDGRPGHGGARADRGRRAARRAAGLRRRRRAVSGCAVAARHLPPECRVFGVEPEAGNDMQQSLRGGEIVHIDVPRTIADGAQTQHVGRSPSR